MTVVVAMSAFVTVVVAVCLFMTVSMPVPMAPIKECVGVEEHLVDDQDQRVSAKHQEIR